MNQIVLWMSYGEDWLWNMPFDIWNEHAKQELIGESLLKWNMLRGLILIAEYANSLQNN